MRSSFRLALFAVLLCLIPDGLHILPGPFTLCTGWFPGIWLSLVAQEAEAQSIPPVDETTRRMIAAGARLFFTETFAGNGRTCATCHRPEQSFALPPEVIAALPAEDPLFVAETNPQLAALEDATRLRQDGLILVNPDGFANPPVFRASPPLFNLAHSGPFGLNGTFDTLEDFIRQAIRQHFPRTLARVEGDDFRLPSAEELGQLVAFLRSLEVPYDRDFTLARLVRTPAQQQGMALFFGEAKCSQCHGGVTLSEAAEALGGGNRAFDTGVNTLEVLEPLRTAEAGRVFSTPSLFGIGHTAPFFHNNQFATLRETVAFYNTETFNTSPAAAEVGPITLNTEQVNNLVAFLESLTCPHDGDVNRDGRVTPADAQGVLQQYLGTTAAPMDTCRQDQGDVESSGNGLTPADTVCLLREFLGNPCPEPGDLVPTQVVAISCQDMPGGECRGVAGTEIPLVVQVSNRSGMGVPGVAVVFSLGDTDPLGTFTTNAQGRATLSLPTAPPFDVAGVFLVTASVPELEPVRFTITLASPGDGSIRVVPLSCNCEAEAAELVVIGVQVTDADSDPPHPRAGVMVEYRLTVERGATTDRLLARDLTRPNGQFSIDFPPDGLGLFVVTGTVFEPHSTRQFEVTFYIQVSPRNEPPIIEEPPGDQMNVERDVVSLPIAVSDPNGDTLTCSATGLPPGLSISRLNATTCLLVGTIADGAAAGSPYTSIITVTDPREASDRAFFRWIVRPFRNCPTPSQPATLAFGELVGCDIEMAGEVKEFDVFEFQARAGERVRIAMTGAQSNVCPVLELFAPDGGSIATARFGNSCNADNELPARLEITLPETGTYNLVASDAGEATGSYSLSLLSLFPSASSTPILQFGSTIADAIDIVGRSKLFAFEGCAGDTIRVIMNATRSAVCPVLELFAPPDGNRVSHVPFGGTCNTSTETPAQIDTTLPSTGRYTLVASDNELDAVGDYSLSLSRFVGGNCIPMDITVTPASAAITPGTTQVFTATGRLPDETVQDLTTAVRWEAFAPEVAGISNAAQHQGLATGESEGSTAITASFGGASGEATLTVARLTAIEITPAESAVAVGEMQQLTATGVLANGARQDLTSVVTWASMEPAVATISNAEESRGLVTAVSEGTTTITTTFREVIGMTSFRTVPPPPETIRVTPADMLIAIRTTQQLTATGMFGGEPQDLTTMVTWASNNPAVVTVSTTGLVTGEAAGTTTITATLGSVMGEVSITVLPLNSIAVTPAETTITLGGTQQFTATGTLANGSTQNLTLLVTWESSEGTVATISNTAGSYGLATGAAEGSAIIAAVFGEVRGETTLHVTPDRVPESEIMCDENGEPVPREPLLINYGDHVVGCRIDPSTNIDRFFFMGSAGEQVRIAVLSRTPGFDPRIEMRDRDGAVILDTFCQGNPPFSNPVICSISQDVLLTLSGDYLISVSDQNPNEIGTYILQIERIIPFLNSQNIPYSLSIIDEINPQTDIDFFLLSGVDTSIIRIVVLSRTPGFDPRIEMRDRDGTVILDTFCQGNPPFSNPVICSISRDISLISSGDFLISVSDQNSNEIGAYEISIECLFGPCLFLP